MSPVVVPTAAPTRAPGRRGLGLWMATALVVGNMIGSGIFLLPSSLAGFGSISIVGWVLTAGGALMLALVFARLGRAFPTTGGPYAYARRAFGDFTGFLTAWGYWIAVWVGNAAIAVAFVGYLGYFWGDLGTNRPLAAAVAIGAVWLLTAVNAAGIRSAGAVQAVTTALKLLPLAAIGLVGIFFIDSANLTPFNASTQSGYGAVTSVAALTLWAFIGIESATIPAEDVENPRRNIPRATVVGTLVAAAVYILGTVAVMGILPSSRLAASTAPFADAAELAFGGWAGTTVAVAACISAFGALNGWILLQAQVPFAAARDEIFPAAFARTTKQGVPVVGLVTSSALVTALTLTRYNASLIDQFNFVILLATLTTLVPYVFSAAAELLLLVTDPQRFEARTFRRDAVIAVIAIAYSIWTVAGSGYAVVYQGFILLLLGIPVFCGMKFAAARKGTRVVATGTAEAILAHRIELHLPDDLDAALEQLTAAEHAGRNTAASTEKG